MRIGIYGGSFNPPHLGHAMVSAWLLWADRVDEVWLLPTYRHPFSKSLLDFEHRVRLCQAMADEVRPAQIRVCTVESRLPSPSYTVDTLRHLQSEHAGHQFHLVVGADVVQETHRWKQWSAIEAQWPPIFVGRQGYPTPSGAVDFPGISSTQIRAAIARSEDVSHWVPEGVLRSLDGAYSSGVKAIKP